MLEPQGRSTTIHMPNVIITPDSERRYQVLADKEMLASSKMGWRHELRNTCPTSRQTSMCATARHLLHLTKKPFQDADHNRMLIGDLGSQVPTSKRHIERSKRVFWVKINIVRDMVKVLLKGVTTSIFTALKTEEADTRLHGTMSKALEILIFSALKCLIPQYETVISHRHTSTGKTSFWKHGSP